MSIRIDPKTDKAVDPEDIAHFNWARFGEALFAIFILVYLVKYVF